MERQMMILGAGIYQVPLIKKARQLGFHTIVASYPGPYPGFALADEALYLDTTDAEGILAAARERRIDGICTTGTDVAVRSIGLVNDELGLSGISGRAARILTDKSLMKEAFAGAGVRTAAFRRVFSVDEAKEAFLELGAPCVVKVTDKSGSRGIIRVDSEKELETAFAAAREVTGKPYLLVEKFIEGHEIGVDAFICQGKPVLLLPHDKLVFHGERTTVPVGHIFPYEMSAALAGDLEEQVRRIVRAAGMDNCAMNMDAFIVGEEIYVIEAGGRCGATCIPELISLYGGIDYYGQMLRAAAGEAADFSLTSAVSCRASLLYREKPGKLLAIRREKIAEMEKRGILVSFDYAPGAELPAMRDGTDRIGQVIAPCADAEEFEEIFREAMDCAVVEE